MPVYLGRLLILITPLVLVLLEIFHPLMYDASTAFQVFHREAAWWIGLQIFQIALAALLILVVFRTIARRRGATATLSRIGLWSFLVLSLLYSGTLGIGASLLVAHTNALMLSAPVCPWPRSSLMAAVTGFLASPIGTALLLLGGLGWIVGVLGAMLSSSPQRWDIESILPPIHPPEVTAQTW